MPSTLPGRSSPLGARYNPIGPRPGVNFSVYSRNSTGLDLLLFEQVDDARPARIIPLDPRANRTYFYWHVFVPGLAPGQLYGFRAHGPFSPATGLRFDSSKLLLDPYARAVAFPAGYDRQAACRYGEDNTAVAPKSVVADPFAYDWQGDTAPRRPFAQTVLYELHPAGFTRHPNSGLPEGKRGTYAGLVEKIPYLLDLGITAVELMPVFAFDPYDAPEGKTNYWGYTPLSFFAPHPFYSASRAVLGALDEFRDMVKAFHRAGLEVILDVVYNHTTENGAAGPTLSLRGLENPAYYLLEGDRRSYANYTGTGNTLNASHPVVRRMIRDSLRYWVAEMHVDGFRFDLASILTRDEQGHPLANPPILWDIESDPYLAGVKLIAEAWDAAGLYQVGSFVGEQWKEWNGRFRDDIRSWVKGDPGCITRFPSRILGSPDLYEHENREPEQSVNFVACHDGFTLNDLVTYDRKHNEANGEGNRDGHDDNRSWNHGIEGPTGDSFIQRVRERQVKNFLAYTLLSIGTPMLLMGDEVRRTQHGNNNAYCQDNELSWFDWSLVEEQASLRRFVRELIRFRRNVVADPEDEGRTLTEELREARIAWHGVRLNQPDWSHGSRSLAMTVASKAYAGEAPDGLAARPRRLMHFLFNTFWEALDFDLPPLPPSVTWRRLLDTNLPSPDDVSDLAEAPAIEGFRYRVANRSVVLLVAEL
jgi:glycogen operon protein